MQLKKLLLILLTIITLSSCDSCGYNHAEQGTIYVLNKDHSINRFGINNYSMYLYDGSKSKWHSTNQQTYNMYNVGDTINTLILTIE